MGVWLARSMEIQSYGNNVNMSKAPRKKFHFFNRGLTPPEDGRADEGPIPALVPLSEESSSSHEDLRDCASLSPRPAKGSSPFYPGDFIGVPGATQQGPPVLWRSLAESYEREHTSSVSERTRKTRRKSDPSLFNYEENDPCDRMRTAQNSINFSVEKILSSELCKGVDRRNDDTYVEGRVGNAGSSSASNDTQDNTGVLFDGTFHGILARRLVSSSAVKVPLASDPGAEMLRKGQAGFGVLPPPLLNGVGGSSVMSAFSSRVGHLTVDPGTHSLARARFELPMEGETSPPSLRVPAGGNTSGTANVQTPQGNESDGGRGESSAPEASPSHRKRRRCRLCMNHNIDVDMKGHKHRCTYLNCPCNACTITRKGRLYMKKQLALTRFQQQTVLHNARKAESANNGGSELEHHSSGARERQPYPRIGELERETENVIDFSLLEKINSKYPNL